MAVLEISEGWPFDFAYGSQSDLSPAIWIARGIMSGFSLSFGSGRFNRVLLTTVFPFASSLIEASDECSRPCAHACCR